MSLSVVPSPTSPSTLETLAANSFAYSTAMLPIPTAINAGSTITFPMVSTITQAPSVSLITPHITLPTPSCILPSHVKQCQSQWDAYESTIASLAKVAGSPTEDLESNSRKSVGSSWTQLTFSGTTSSVNALRIQRPSCYQASIRPSVCQSLQSSFITSWQGRTDPGKFGNATVTTESEQQSNPWPASSLLGPECTVGCADCAITGGTIRLIYWPVTKTAVPETYLVTASAFGTVFTSPTVYISLASVYASDSCSQIGTSYGPTILPLEPTQLSSVWESYPHFMNAQTAWFNFTDLVGSTLSASVASRRPQCAVWLSSQFESSAIYNPNTTCPADYCGEPIGK